MPARREVSAAGRTAQARKRTGSAATEALHPGDTYEHSITIGIKHKGHDYWLKEGVAIVVQDGESTAAAKDRAQGFVMDALTTQIDEITNDDD